MDFLASVLPIDTGDVISDDLNRERLARRGQIKLLIAPGPVSVAAPITFSVRASRGVLRSLGSTAFRLLFPT